MTGRLEKPLKSSLYLSIASCFLLACFTAFPILAIEGEVLRVGVIPQQSSKKIKQTWGPLLSELSHQTGLKLELVGSANIATFQERLMTGYFDMVYTNPYSYVVAHNKYGFEAIAKEKNKKLSGILIVRKDSNISTLSDLSNKNLVFPANAFAATEVTQSHLKKNKIKYNANFRRSHDICYSLVALKKFDAAGGVMRTFNAMPASVKNKLKILEKFQGVTPHAFAVHPNVNNENKKKLQMGLVNLSQSDKGKKLLGNLKFDALEIANNLNWEDVRLLMDDEN